MMMMIGECATFNIQRLTPHGIIMDREKHGHSLRKRHSYGVSTFFLSIDFWCFFFWGAGEGGGEGGSQGGNRVSSHQISSSYSKQPRKVHIWGFFMNDVGRKMQ